MAKQLNIFEPMISQVVEGLQGKVILIYGKNNTGKSRTATSMSKPFYLPFEDGLSAIPGIPYERIDEWADFKLLNMQLTSKATRDRAREVYDTIVVDQVDAASKYCQDFICQKYGVSTIKEGK